MSKRFAGTPAMHTKAMRAGLIRHKRDVSRALAAIRGGDCVLAYNRLIAAEISLGKIGAESSWGRGVAKLTPTFARAAELAFTFRKACVVKK